MIHLVITIIKKQQIDMQTGGIVRVGCRALEFLFLFLFLQLLENALYSGKFGHLVIVDRSQKSGLNVSKREATP